MAKSNVLLATNHGCINDRQVYLLQLFLRSISILFNISTNADSSFSQPQNIKKIIFKYPAARVLNSN